MKTKADFQALIAAAISDYPVAAQLYQARDPRLLASLDAMAAQLALISAEQDVAAMEPFTKSRDMTVLADAAVKGVLPFGQPKRVRVQIVNASQYPFTVVSGRRILDTQGRVYVVVNGASVPGSTVPGGPGTAQIDAEQRTETTFSHTVTISQPFYRIDVPQPDPGTHIAEVRVRDSMGNTFHYKPDYLNVADGERMFHLETDEARQLYIQFGATGIAGYQPAAGETMTITVVETEGAYDLAAGSQFAFEYGYSLYENGAKLTLSSVLAPGASPMDIATLREVTSYPSLYDTNAVYLANFDFLVRRALSPFRFLSIWNEQREEEVRAASIDNINRLFVSASKEGVDAGTLFEQIKDVIAEADDSYRCTWVPPVNFEIPVTITAYVPPVYDFAAVSQQIKEIVLAEYGETSAWAKRGQGWIKKKRITEECVDAVQALQDEASDIDVTVTDPPAARLPEQFRYVSATSLTINVVQAQ